MMENYPQTDDDELYCHEDLKEEKNLTLFTMRKEWSEPSLFIEAHLAAWPALPPSIPSPSTKGTETVQSEKSLGQRLEVIFRTMLVVWCVEERAARSICPPEPESDKTVTVSRESGEFGFRIHGSRPVVVSAIEPDTPAETSGLEVGDIILSINGSNVLDSSHSEVVRLAHAGCDTLRLEVARTCDVLTPLVTQDPTPFCAGYLYKLGSAQHAAGAPAIVRKWHRRWFVLKKDHCLYYYKSEMEQHPLGAVHLLDYSVHSLAEMGKPFSFTVAKFGGMTLHLAAHSEDARNRWGQVITQAAVEAAQKDELLEISSRRVQQPPASITMPDCFGFLFKLGARWHQWKRRYCVLKDASLFLYHEAEAQQAIGVVHLHGYRVQSTSIGGKKHAFELLPPEPKFRHFYFYTESDSDKKRWLAALEYSIDRWIKVG
uniref:PDZ domain-containing protein n=2 Tax=Scylla olivacea TaxID=85551 RepID=A0A0P4WAZ4_SCYOL